jgi:hypothetical protein
MGYYSCQFFDEIIVSNYGVVLIEEDAWMEEEVVDTIVLAVDLESVTRLRGMRRDLAMKSVGLLEDMTRGDLHEATTTIEVHLLRLKEDIMTTEATVEDTLTEPTLILEVLQLGCGRVVVKY